MNKAIPIVLIIAILMTAGIEAANASSQGKNPQKAAAQTTKSTKQESTVDKIVDATMNNDFADFFKGFAKGLSPKAYGAIQQCFKRSVSMESSMKIKSDIESLSWKNMKQSAVAIGEITELFFLTLKDCKQAQSDASDLISILTKTLSGMIFVDAAIRFVTSPIKFSNTATTSKNQKDLFKRTCK